MKKTVVLYASKYGFTKQYAQWISEFLGCEILDIPKTKTSQLIDYDVIIAGGGIYAGSINGADFIKKYFDLFSEKELILFTTGIFDPANKKAMASILEQNFSKEQLKSMRVFHFRGGIDHTLLGFKDKMTLNMMKKMLTKSKNISEEGQIILDSFGKRRDFSSEKSILPLTNYAAKKMK